MDLPDPQRTPKADVEASVNFAVSTSGPARGEAIRWAVEVIRARLKEPSATPLLVDLRIGLAGIHVHAFSPLLEWALLLEITSGLRGAGKVRRDLRGQAAKHRSDHSVAQLQLAASAVRLGWDAELEPKTVAGPPADVLIAADSALSIEVKIRHEAEATIQAMRMSGELQTALNELAVRHNAWIDGRCGGFLRADQLVAVDAALIEWSEAEGSDTWADGDAQFVFRPRSEPSTGRIGPPVDFGGWEHLMPSLIGKAERMQTSGAGWLFLEAHVGLWGFSDWAVSPSAAKIKAVRRALDATYDVGPRPEGIVLTSPCRSYLGVLDEQFDTTTGGTLIRQAIAPMRARESIIISSSSSGTEAVAELVKAQSGWVDWALDKLGLTSLQTLL